MIMNENLKLLRNNKKTKVINHNVAVLKKKRLQNKILVVVNLNHQKHQETTNKAQNSTIKLNIANAQIQIQITIWKKLKNWMIYQINKLALLNQEKKVKQSKKRQK